MRIVKLALIFPFTLRHSCRNGGNSEVLDDIASSFREFVGIQENVNGKKSAGEKCAAWPLLEASQDFK
jgi:hypothetical protein